MDNGLVVAITSIVTIFLTGIFNLLSKRLDSVQKVEEHQLTIRSIYVTKKIEAGQLFVARMNARINSYYACKIYLEEYRFNKKQNKDLYNKMRDAEKNVSDMYVGKDNITSLYFAFKNSTDDLEKLEFLYNEHFREMNKDSAEYSKNIEEQINKILAVIPQIISILRERVVAARNELGRYDIFS